MKQALEKLSNDWESHLKDLTDLATIPSVSFDGFPPSEVKSSALAVSKLLTRSGLENVEVLELPGVHPYVYGEWLGKPGAPTALLYAHHDVQPPGREHVWKTKPFEPVVKDGPGGARLFGRGTADDKAGIIVHTAAIASILQTHGELPINVKVIIEGEEEIGSEHLEEFLNKYREKFSADVLVLTDTLNFDSGTPGLTVALRGMVGVEIELQSIDKTVHSGMWGGPVPDPAMGLSKLLASFMKDDGTIDLPGIDGWSPNWSEEERRAYSDLPYDEKLFREQCGMIDGVKILKPEISPFAQIWRYPSMSVNALQSSSREQAGNTINDSAWARVTIRIPPGMDDKKIMKTLVSEIEKRTPWGLKVKIKEDVCASSWMVDPKSTPKFEKAFQLAERALSEGYGKEPVLMGCGGSIPFVEPFANALGGIPALLIGVEDPHTNAHGENESLLLSDFRKACESQIRLFYGLSELNN